VVDAINRPKNSTDRRNEPEVRRDRRDPRGRRGTTATAAIDGISAAGADPELRKHTPSADIEIVADGRPAPDSVVPVSPSGCPTPAVVTRAVRELVGFEFVGVDAGLAVPTAPTGAQVLDAGAAPGGDVRDPEPVPDAAAIFEAARGLVPEIVESRTNASDGDDVDADDDRELLVAETIPGGTTTALGVLTALGERPAVSSSLPANPLEPSERSSTRGCPPERSPPLVTRPTTRSTRSG